MPEARELAEAQMREIARMPFEEVLRLVEHPVVKEVSGPLGRRHRSKTYAFWDAEPHESDLYIRTKITGRGLRSFQRYYGGDTRGPENDFASSAEADSELAVSATWTEIAAWILFAVAIAALPAGLLLILFWR
jgi:hypothetical protein